MNMLQFDKGVWILHRKLHHRFLKYQNYFVEATEDLPEYQVRDGQNVVSTASKSKSTTAGGNVISLLTESEDSDLTEDES